MQRIRTLARQPLAGQTVLLGIAGATAFAIALLPKRSEYHHVSRFSVSQ